MVEALESPPTLDLVVRGVNQPPMKRKSDLREEIEQFEHEVDSFKEQMNSTPKHLSLIHI